MILEIVRRLAERGGEDVGVMINGMTLNNFRFMDDIYLIADTEVNLQQLTDRADGSRMGLKINTGNTKTMTIGKEHEDTQIKLGEVLEQYLGGTLTEDGRCT